MKKMKFLVTFVLLLSMSFAAVAQPASSDAILKKAYATAAKEHKNVIIIFHASWCGWCKKMDRSMADATVKKYFDDNYVTVHMTVQESPDKKNEETPGAAAFLDKYKGGKAGLPFFVIMDSKGEKIADSFGEGGNIGCPASEKEVAQFISMLKKTSTIDAEGLAAITTVFRKNENH